MFPLPTCVLPLKLDSVTVNVVFSPDAVVLPDEGVDGVFAGIDPMLLWLPI